jgi:hypothetical protein
MDDDCVSMLERYLFFFTELTGGIANWTMLLSVDLISTAPWLDLISEFWGFYLGFDQ